MENVLSIVATSMVAFALVMIFFVGLVVTYKRIRGAINRDAYITKAEADHIKQQNDAINAKLKALQHK